MARIEMERGATFSRDRRHRFELSRRWDTALPTIGVVMLNPSLASDERDDPTIRAVIGFATAWGFGGFRAVNLFSLITPDPSTLRSARVPVRLPRNDEHILGVARACDRLWLAWGNHGAHLDRATAVERLLGAFEPGCVGVTKLGAPRHPLYQPRSLELTPYRSARACAAADAAPRRSPRRPGPRARAGPR